jgi:hypothetical protein
MDTHLSEHAISIFLGLSNVVYAGNLSWSTTDEQLLAFASAGDGVISAEIKRHDDTKRSKGWG